LRPLWFLETEKEYFFSSERGVIHLENMVQDARPLAPGEKMALQIHRGQNVEIFNHADIRRHVMTSALRREAPPLAGRFWGGWSPSAPGATLPQGGIGGGGDVQVSAATAVETMLVEVAPHPAYTQAPWSQVEKVYAVDTTVLAATGWNRDHLQEIESLATEGKDLVGSLGHDGPLAVLSKERVNLADFYKETVAVVTNPSIDRERETEAFSTRTLVGARPALGAAPHPEDHLVVLETPLLPGGHPLLGGEEVSHEVASALGTLTMEALVGHFESRMAWLVLGIYPDETATGAVQRLMGEAVDAVREGAQCLVLDDFQTIQNGLGWLDPHLATGAIDRALREAEDAVNLRRRAGLVVRSASVRTLHDLALLSGFGADAINPYAMLVVAVGGNKAATAVTDEGELIERQHKVLKTLTEGLEKVTSTIGCHELRGYGRVFSSIGLAPSVADLLRTPNFFGSEDVGLTWERLDQEAAARRAELCGEAKAQLARVDRLYPKFWKKAESLANGELTPDEFTAIYHDLITELPVSLRHTLGLKTVSANIDPAEVDLTLGNHQLPILISAMSFGSQGELAYRAYADAAVRLNILCMNGEGGELPDLLTGHYKPYRGQQVASGRFGVNAQFLNSACVIEIKIGQGAKPGEGGMLPASKVTPQVAEARRTNPYVPLISPSNNHDIYSIEDLAQLIEELKTVNPQARVSVKVPVVPDIGIIAVGVAKAGADIINLTGYDGATGAARKHALQYVGLPTEIGVIQAHRALIQAGLRHRVELWCDGGMKTGSDAVKMILLGANRVGFATMAMVAIGCTICRKCNEGTCHVGITTHIKTVEEATEKGIKSFVPRDANLAVDGITRVFEAIGGEMRRLTAQLGATRLQDLVGRADLLEQIQCQEQVDLSPMLFYTPMQALPEAEPGIGRRLTRPRNTLTKIVTDLMIAAVEDGEHEASYQDEVMAFDRALGSHLAGELVRQPDLEAQLDRLHLNFGPSSIAGNGFAAWTTEQLDLVIEGGAQDGVAKGANGGRVAIMKGLNHNGLRLDGSVGKSFAYGAQRGVFIVQGDADARACVRLSGADVIFGGEITEPVDDSEGLIGMRANLKGFACEYMTSGRVLILGDPGPYAFAGMTGGVVYQQLSPEWGLDEDALRRRLAKGAKVTVKPVDGDDVPQIQDLLGHYIVALQQTDQYEVAERIAALSQPDVLPWRFVKIVPVRA
jgi:glutamate synthase (NADPH/NADH) large chain